MKTILELQDDLSHLIRSAEDVQARAEKGNRELTVEEKKDCKQYLSDAESIKAQIKSLEDDEALRDQIKAERTLLIGDTGRKTTPINAPDGKPTPDRVEIIPFAKRFGALKAFKGKDAELNAFKSGQFLLARFYDNAKAKRWCSDHGVDINASMSEGSNTAGGALVPEEMSQAIIDLRETYGVFRKYARIRPMAGDTLQVPRVTGHVTASFVAEATAGTASDMAFNLVQLVAKKLYALTYVSVELAEDAVVSVVDQLTKDFAYAFALKEDQCGFTGDGTQTYGGINGLTNLFTASSRAGAIDAATNHDTFAEIDDSDLAKLRSALPAYARVNAKYYCHRVALELVFNRLKAVAGGNTVMTLEGKPMDTYLGDEIVVSQVLPSTTGDLSDLAMIFYGDLSMSSSLGERRGITIRRSDEIKFVEDQIALKATERIDIVNHDTGDASTAGPIVALIGE